MKIIGIGSWVYIVGGGGGGPGARSAHIIFEFTQNETRVINIWKVHFWSYSFIEYKMFSFFQFVQKSEGEHFLHRKLADTLLGLFQQLQ